MFACRSQFLLLFFIRVFLLCIRLGNLFLWSSFFEAMSFFSVIFIHCFVKDRVVTGSVTKLCPSVIHDIVLLLRSSPLIVHSGCVLFSIPKLDVVWEYYSWTRIIADLSFFGYLRMVFYCIFLGKTELIIKSFVFSFYIMLVVIWALQKVFNKYECVVIVAGLW